MKCLLCPAPLVNDYYVCCVQRHWSMRSHTKTIDKLKRKLAEQVNSSVSLPLCLYLCRSLHLPPSLLASIHPSLLSVSLLLSVCSCQSAPVSLLLSVCSCQSAPVSLLLSVCSCQSAPVSLLLSVCSCQSVPVSLLLSVCSCQSAPVSLVLSVCSCQSVPVSLLLSVCSCRSAPVSLFLSVCSCQSAPVSLLLSICLIAVCLSVHPFVSSLTVRPSVRPSVHPSIHPSILCHLSVSLPVCPVVHRCSPCQLMATFQ